MEQLSPTATASSAQMDYMTLLVTQLQNQNPLEPLDNNEMASQLAQFSQLQQLETMNSSFADALSVANSTYANSLIGKEVSFITETETGDRNITSGVVEQVYKKDGENLLVVGDYVLSTEDIMSIKN